jgi:queuosine precursor transporter
LSTKLFSTSSQPPAQPRTEDQSSAVPVATLSRAVIVVVAAYVAAQMLADIASLKIGVVAGLAVDMGTFIYPITFTLRDAVHKVVGKRNTQVLIVCAAVINLLMVLYLTWAAAVPSDPESFGGLEFSLVFAPLWRIVIASILAEVVSELLDTEVYHWFVTRITRRYQWLRVLVSNSVSVPVDNLIFVLIAFAPVALPLIGEPLVGSWRVTWEIFAFNLIVKYGMTLLSLPLIYAAPDRDWDGEK